MRQYIMQSKLIVGLFFLLFISTALTAPAPKDVYTPRPAHFDSVDYNVIDTYARRTPESAARNLNTLGDYLTEPAHSDLAKARSIYAWITSHVRYDASAFSGQRFSSEVEYANRVLRSRKAVCTGFALLYKHLLNRAGIDVVNIRGYSRTNDNEAGQPIQRVDHEWNAIKLDGEWHLVDIAWAQTTARNDSNGETRPNDFYFLTEPLAFAANHFPVDIRWQLLDPLISKGQFDQFPRIYDAYFRLGFDTNFPKDGAIRANETATLSFQNEKDIEFLCSLGRVGGSTASQVPVSVRRAGSTYYLTVPVAHRGPSTLYVFARPKGPRTERLKSYEGIASFTISKG